MDVTTFVTSDAESGGSNPSAEDDKKVVLPFCDWIHSQRFDRSMGSDLVARGVTCRGVVPPRRWCTVRWLIRATAYETGKRVAFIRLEFSFVHPS